MSPINQEIQERLDKKIKKEEKSFLGFFIKNFKITYLLLIAVLIFGFFSLFSLPREANPEVEVPYASITTTYAGASPGDVETLITEEIESKIENLENLNNYESQSGLGFSSVLVEFDAEADLEDSFRKLRKAVDEVKVNLPEDAQDPNIREIRMNDLPIITYSLIGDYNNIELKTYAENFKEKLENIKNVSRVEIMGGVDKEFQVFINPSRLANYNLSLNQVIGAISQNNINLPSGEIEIDDYRYNVKVKGKIENVDELKKIAILNYEGSPVLIEDVALVKEGLKDKKTESRIGFKNEEPRNTLSLQMYKKTGGNILEIVEESKNIANNTKENYFPSDLKLEITNDNSKYIKDDLSTLGKSAIQTFILITLILLIILSFRGALITAMSVPIAFLMSFFFLYIQDMTLNSMVLFSLVLSLGLMVDNAIIIIEGINEYVSTYHQSVYKAALLSINNFKSAITSGTLTTVSAFFPILLVSGILGEYMSIIPKTLIVTLLSSLFVALIIIPVLITRLTKIKQNHDGTTKNKKRHEIINQKMQGLYKKYRRTLKNILPSKLKKRTIVIGAWIMLFISIAIPASGLMKIQMFPQIDFDYFYVNLELPPGATLEKTKKITTEVENRIAKIPELDNYVTNLGTQTSAQAMTSSSGENKASITVNLQEENRERNSFEITNTLRKDLNKIQGAEIKVEEMKAGPSSGSAVQLRVFGENLKDIAEASQRMENELKEIPGLVNINNNLENANGEFNFIINKAKANYYGLSVQTIASTVRTAIHGSEASSINLEDEDVAIMVKYSNNKFKNINDLKDLIIFNNQGQGIPLKQIADLELEPSLLNIYHKNGDKVAIISGELTKDASIREITEKINEKKNNLELPTGVTLEIGGENEDIQESFQELFYSMIVAIFLIGFILVLQFNSFKQPLIILFSLPLAIIGVILSLWLIGQSFSITVFIGIVALAGIVVNDAIVLIDRINKNIKEEGMDFQEAVIEGGVARMQPILITSATTIAGILPLVYANAMWRGLSLAVIFGLIFSTLLNLVIVPILYTSMCKPKKQ